MCICPETPPVVQPGPLLCKKAFCSSEGPGSRRSAAPRSKPWPSRLLSPAAYPRTTALPEPVPFLWWPGFPFLWCCVLFLPSGWFRCFPFRDLARSSLRSLFVVAHGGSLPFFCWHLLFFLGTCCFEFISAILRSTETGPAYTPVYHGPIGFRATPAQMLHLGSGAPFSTASSH